MKKLDDLLRHVNHVRDSCLLLGERLIESGEEELGIRLICNGYKHDSSKFSGIEWEALGVDADEDSKVFKAAVHQHVTTNPHHPEYWFGIKNMPRLYIAEMVCDWHARAIEFGTDLREWIIKEATEKFDFTTSDKVYRQIKEFIDILLDRKF